MEKYPNLTLFHNRSSQYIKIGLYIPRGRVLDWLSRVGLDWPFRTAMFVLYMYNIDCLLNKLMKFRDITFKQATL